MNNALTRDKMDFDRSVTREKEAIDFKFKVDMVLLYVFAAEEPEGERDESVAQLAMATYDYWMKSENGRSEFTSMATSMKMAEEESTFRKASVILKCINHDRLEERHMPEPGTNDSGNVTSLDKYRNRKGE